MIVLRRDAGSTPEWAPWGRALRSDPVFGFLESTPDYLKVLPECLRLADGSIGAAHKIAHAIRVAQSKGRCQLTQRRAGQPSG